MLLLSDCISFADPRCKLIIEIRKTVHAERVHVISWRESLHAQKTAILNTAGKDKVADEVISPHLHGDE